MIYEICLIRICHYLILPVSWKAILLNMLLAKWTCTSLTNSGYLFHIGKIGKILTVFGRFVES